MRPQCITHSVGIYAETAGARIGFRTYNPFDPNEIGGFRPGIGRRRGQPINLIEIEAKRAGDWDFSALRMLGTFPRMKPLDRVKRIAGSPTSFLLLCGPGLLWRRFTAARRGLPGVYLLGGPRCGSTSFAIYLAEHPAYLEAQSRELMFLQDLPEFETNHSRNRVLDRLWGHYEDGPLAYRKFFPLQSRIDAVEGLTGDHTPFYLYCPTAMERVRAATPDAKFVILLRNPVDRAFSDYNVNRQFGWLEERSFEQAVEEELSGRCENFRMNYLYQGVYEPHVARWIEAFGRDRFLILDSREMFKEPVSVIRRVYEFLGLRDHHPGSLKPHNRVEPATPLDPVTRRRLERYFEPHNERLWSLLGERFSWGQSSSGRFLGAAPLGGDPRVNRPAKT